jgi:hypothetical protein
MISDRALRPSAAEVISFLDSDLSTSPTSACASCQFKHDKHLSTIEDLKRKIVELYSVIETLTKKQQEK